MYSVGIIGSGPGAFYTALRLIKQRPSIRITIYERLQHPFGLVRFGVAPDHPEIRNCAHSFEHLLRDHSQSVTLVTGKEITSLSDSCLEGHDAIVVAIGAQGDKRLGIEGEDECIKRGFALFQSKDFVSFYNKSPTITPDLQQRLISALKETRHLCLIGTGNVALDIARIIAKSCDNSQSNPEYQPISIQHLKLLEKISIVGRRGPLQCTFTAKELREFLHSTTSVNLLEPNPKPFNNLLTRSVAIGQLNRHSRRIFDIWNETKFVNRPQLNHCNIQFEFMQEPKRILFNNNDGITGLELSENEFTTLESETTSVEEVKVKKTGKSIVLDCTFIVSSIGYALKRPLFDLPFEGNRIRNERGRVRSRIYVSGWCKTGPRGDITSTMVNAYETADSILQDLPTNQ